MQVGQNELQMVEYHVDTIDLFQQELNSSTLFGGHLSVRKNQDESNLGVSTPTEPSAPWARYRPLETK